MYKRADAAVAERPVFHRSVARAAGLSDDQIRFRVRTGIWVAVLPGVYRHASVACTPALMRDAALLWAGPTAVLSHRSAAAIWDLDVAEPAPEITVAGRSPRHSEVIVHRGRLEAGHTTAALDTPCTTLPRTLVDLAAVVDPPVLEAAIERARHRRGLALSSVHATLDSVDGQRKPGVGRLRRVLDAIEGNAPCESMLEVKVARRLRASGLPEPVRQHWVRIFGERYRLDFAWPEVRVALECDGRAFHEFQRDRTKWRQLGASGWRVLPITWQDVTRRWDVVEGELRAALV